MRFHKTEGPNPYFNARDQRRLLLMVATLGAVVMGFQFAAQPESWYWLTGPPVDAQSSAANPPEKPIDARLNPEADAVPPGGFRLAEPLPANPPVENPQQVDDNDPTRLDPTLLSNLYDNKLGIRNAEQGAYYKILAQARELSEQQLESAAADAVTFAQMFTDPDDYRGRLVTIHGRVKQLTPMQAVKNDFGIETVYEAWMLTPDSGTNPVLMHFTNIPEGIPTGTDLDLDCRFTGYFFKKYAFVAQHGPHSTTMLLGKELRWTPPQTIAPELGLAPYILGVVVLMGVVLAALFWRYSAGDRRFRRTQLQRIQHAAHEPLVDLETAPLQELQPATEEEPPGPDA
ncbi:hypothetical protein Pan258_08050 [Symmachiella dynata]|uniref:hypothetical protein n=1 Tax=Symmachiella dynata TaxID=2527995 RepID=UPI00118D05BB|nr:hypothetical protein [Symmachiella dynata]QDT46785.1 hypothetical protein Pan258_08050 [Symmachiella dynata]